MRHFFVKIIMWISLFLTVSGFINAEVPTTSYVKANLQLDNITVTDVTGCYGNSNGELEIQVSGGKHPYRYSIDNGASYAANNLFTGLSAGVYFVIVEDVYGEMVSGNAVIGQPTKLHISNTLSTNVTGCYGDSNGTISITAINGTPPYTYSIDGGATFHNNGGNFTGLPAGSYSVVVQDNNGCIKVGQNINITQPVELEIVSVGKSDVNGCYGETTGSIEIISTGGTPLIQYSIDGVNFQTSKYFGGLPVGTYHAWVKDSKGCTVDGGEQIITQPAEIIITNETVTNVNTCFGENTGSINVSATGGSGHLEYAITGVYQVSNNFPDLYAGNYTITVIDEHGCIVNGSDVTITQPTPVLINSDTKTDVTGCYGDNTGQIIINASGGTPPLKYSIDDGTNFQSSGTFPNLLAGSYQTYVEDNNGCFLRGESHFLIQPGKIILDNADVTDVTTCYGANNGTMTILAYGGVAPLEYSPDNGITWYPNNYITGLTAGTYGAQVRDANLCKVIDNNTLTINQPSELQVTSEVPQAPSCYGGVDGQITIQATGGTGTVIYSVNGGTNYYEENVVTGLSAGIPYSISVMDGNNCTAIGGTYTLSNPPELIITNTNVQDVSSCHGGANGSIEITATGGTGQIHYSIDGGLNYVLTPLFENLTAGDYQVMVKDDNGCITTGSLITISQPSPVSISNIMKTNIEGCNGENIGSITIQASGGTSPFEYSINGGVDYYANGGIFNNLPAGSYEIYVKDQKNCSAIGNTVTITQPEVLYLDTIAHKDIQCNGQNNGEILMQVLGGAFPYYYSIDGGVSYTQNNIFINLTAGTYTVKIKDSYNCVLDGPVIDIIEPTELKIDAILSENIKDCYGDNTGSITIQSSGGTPEIQYSIDNGYSFYENGGSFENLSAGLYSIIVKDKNRCFVEGEAAIELTQPDRLVITEITTGNITCHGDNDGQIQVNAQGGTGSIQYSLGGVDYFDNAGLFAPLEPGDYSVFVKDENACVASEALVQIYEPPLLVIENITGIDEKCIDSNDGKITIYAIGGSNPLSYSIDGVNYDFNPAVTGLSPGKYKPFVRDYNGCIAEGDSVSIGSPDNSSIFNAAPLLGCSPLSVEFMEEVEGETYLWEFDDGFSSGNTNPTHIFVNKTLSPKNYTVWAYSFSDNGCKDSSSIQITVNPQPQLKFTTHKDTLYFPESEFIINNNSQAGYQNYYWDFGDGTNSMLEDPVSHTYDGCGDYKITMSAYNEWCSDTIETNVVVTAYQPELDFKPDTTGACFPATINFENFSEHGVSYFWDFGNGDTSNDFNASVLYEDYGDYKVSLKADGYCGTYAEKDTIIHIYDSPEIDFSVQPDSIMPPDQPVHCYNYSEGYELEYLWDFGDNSNSEEHSPIHYYTVPGEYKVKLKVVSGYGCIDSLISSNTVLVLPYGVLEFPTAFTPNGDGKNDFFMPAVYSSVAKYELLIYNRTGQLLFRSENPAEGWDGTYQGKKAPQDVYVWRVTGKFKNNAPFERTGNCTLLK